MGPKKGRRVRKIEVTTDSVPEFELENTAADIKWRREEREATEREEEAQKQKQEEAMREEATHSQEEGVAKKKRARIDKSYTETEAGGETRTFQSQSRYKKGHMTNTYLMDSDEKAIVDFVKDHNELYNKTRDHFKDKARKECLWERFTNSRQFLSTRHLQRFNQDGQYGDQHAVNRHHITASRSHQHL